MNNAKNYHVVASDDIREKMRSYLDEKKRFSLEERSKTLVVNRRLKKEHLPQLPVETIYTIKNFAEEIECNPSTLRKALNGYGKLPAQSIDKFVEITSGELEEIFFKRDIPANKIRICRKKDCDNDFIRWAPNRKYCDIHSRAVRRKQK